MKITNLTIHETRDAINKGDLTYQEVTQAYVDRMENVEPEVGAYLTTTKEEALEQAKNRSQSGQGEKGDLFGIPYALKDNMCTKGIKTTCASKILGNFVPPYNADVYDRLESEGGVLLGKLNMDEFAMGSSTENSAYKITKNPWDTTKVPGGSSGGSAVAVAAEMAAYSLGSDTGGSIRQPAAFCGIVGLKPTYGLVSRFGLVAYASSLDQIGPCTKDVEDAALVLNAIAGHDSKDSTSIKQPKKDYLLGLKDGVKGLKIGVCKAFGGENLQPEISLAMDDTLKIYKDAGAEIVDLTFETLDFALSAYYIIASAEASSNLARYDGVRYGVRAEEYKDLVDMYTKTRTQGFGDEVKRRIMLGTYALSSGYYDAYYKKAMQVRTLIMAEYKRVFGECDFLITPTTPSTAFGIGEKTGNPLDMYLADLFTVPINIAGIPAISIPVGLDKAGLPIGLQLVGPALSEDVLLRGAYALEQVVDFRKHSPKLG